MSRSESVVIPFPTPANPLLSHVANDYSVLAAAEYRAALLAKLLRHMPEQELADISNAMLSELVVLYRQAINQAQGRAGHE
ncbi:hypothetical protein F7R01_05770 [Pseudomonas argentinensis]|uniref:Uncharacterized protein n=1 Tax=Phytopseudomonas argentinensis TaxID=289370 RepID=A0A1I3KAM3_9GAMM|nr:hypothetical protein [Pseudomonas argentinensis]KAB0550716.1 hypothetical protein F7R01_05770 [Pseudomonas argentinensis]SFI69348.1 hypothetical protein SAMN05216602_2373 [Pseudomonas argentinensis]